MSVWAVARRLPFTLGFVGFSLILGVFTQTLWRPLQDQSWWTDIAFGAPAMADGRLWTVATGSFFAPYPLGYIPVIVFFVLPVGLCEWVLGTRRTALAWTLLQIVGIIGGGYLMLALAQTDWTWAQQVASQYDVGSSGGALGAAMLVSAAVRQPWRARLRLVVLGYIAISFVFFGFVYDIEHAVGALVGLAAGPWVAGRRPSLRRPVFSRREARSMAAAYFAVSALASVVAQSSSREGPFGQVGGDSEAWWWVVTVVLIDLFIARGLLKGRRGWWRFALAITVAQWIVEASTAVLILTGQSTNSTLFWMVFAVETSQIALLVVWRAAFRNPSRRTLRGRAAGSGRIGAEATQAERERAIEMLETVGSANRLSWIATWPEKHWWFHDRGVVAYDLRLGVALGLCDPVTGDADRYAVAEGFIEAARDAGTVPCFFSCSADLARWAQDRGWVAVQVAEEAVVDLAGLEFKGKKWQDVRSAFNQAEKQGITTRFMRLDEAPRSIRTQITAISEEWVRDKGLPEMGFTLGGVDEADDPRVWVNVAIDADMTVHGVTSWMPAHGADGEIVGWTLDLMRRLPGGFRYTMELLIASACVRFRDEGYRLVSLSGAPLAHAGAADSAVDRSMVDSMLERTAATLEPYYGFGSLQAFKGKFQPRYEPLFLVAPDEAALPKVAMAIGRAYLPDLTLRQAFTVMRSGTH